MNHKARARRVAATIVVAGAAAAGLAVVPSLAASASEGHGNAGSLPPRRDQARHRHRAGERELRVGDVRPVLAGHLPERHAASRRASFVKSYYAVGHVSLDNYIAQVSGQAPNLVTSSDCVSSPAGPTTTSRPAPSTPTRPCTPARSTARAACSPSRVQTIGNQLDRGLPAGRSAQRLAASTPRTWATTRPGTAARQIPLGGTDCAHPTQVNGVATDDTNNAEGPNATGSQVKSTITDQYANRHNPFV